MSLILTKGKSSEIHTGEFFIKSSAWEKNYQAIKLIQKFIFDDHVKMLTDN